MPAALGSRLASVGATYRPVGGEFVETTLVRVSVEELMAARPVRDFRPPAATGRHRVGVPARGE